MFNTIVDSINSFITITALLISSVSILCFFINSTLLQKMIRLAGIVLYISFCLGFIFFRNIIENTFDTGVFIAVITIIFCASKWVVQQIISEIPPRMSHEEIEFQCHHCALYEECLSLSACYEANCCDFEPREDDSYESRP